MTTQSVTQLNFVPLKVVYYETSSGQKPLAKWLQKRDRPMRIAILGRIDDVAEGDFGDHRYLQDGVWELRNRRPAWRVYFGVDGDQVVVLLAGSMKGDQNKAIDRAKAMWEEHENG